MPPKEVPTHGPETDPQTDAEDLKANEARHDSQFPRSSEPDVPNTTASTSSEGEENVRPQQPQSSQRPASASSSSTFEGTANPFAPTEPASREQRPVIDTRPLRDRITRQLSDVAISPSTTVSTSQQAGELSEPQKQKSAVSISSTDEQQNIVPAASAVFPGGREASQPTSGVDTFDWATTAAAKEDTKRRQKERNEKLKREFDARTKSIKIPGQRETRHEYERIPQEEERQPWRWPIQPSSSSEESSSSTPESGYESES